MVGLVDDRFPTALARRPAAVPDGAGPRPGCPSGDHHLAEERRLFYVGHDPRAQRSWSSPGPRDYGGRTARRLSPFVTRGARPAAGHAARCGAPQSVAERLGAQRSDPPRARRRVDGPRLADRPAVAQLRAGERLPGVPGPLPLRAPDPDPDPAVAPARSTVARSMPRCRPIHRAQMAGRHDDPRGAAGGARRELGVGRIPDSPARGGAPHGRARGAGALLEGAAARIRRIRSRSSRSSACPSGATGSGAATTAWTATRTAACASPTTSRATSAIRPPRNRRARDSLQLSIYALAYEAQHGQPAGRARAPLPRIGPGRASRPRARRRLTRAVGAGGRRGGGDPGRPLRGHARR